MNERFDSYAIPVFASRLNIDLGKAFVHMDEGPLFCYDHMNENVKCKVDPKVGGWATISSGMVQIQTIVGMMGERGDAQKIIPLPSRM